MGVRTVGWDRGPLGMWSLVLERAFIAMEVRKWIH